MTGIDSDWGGDSQYRGCCVDMACQTRVASRLEQNHISTAAMEEISENKVRVLEIFIRHPYLYGCICGWFYSSLVTYLQSLVQNNQDCVNGNLIQGGDVIYIKCLRCFA